MFHGAAAVPCSILLKVAAGAYADLQAEVTAGASISAGDARRTIDTSRELPRSSSTMSRCSL